MAATNTVAPAPGVELPTVGRWLSNAGGWILVAAAIVVATVLPFADVQAFLAVFALALVLAFVQGVRRYGALLLIAFFGIAFVLSNMWEDTSILTGFPFGHYYYTGGPKLFDVPVMIGVIYFGLGYISWMTASVLLDRADEHLDLRTRSGRLNVFGLPVLAGAAMTMFDVGSDSVASTIGHTWIWRDGGGIFGVPWTNYVGWWFVTWTFFQAFAIVLAARQTRGVRTVRLLMPSALLVQPVGIYLTLGLAAIADYAASSGSTATATDQAGTTWRAASISETMFVITVFSVVVVGLLALFKVVRGDLSSRR